MGRASFTGGHAAHHLGAVGDGLLAVEGTILAGEALRGKGCVCGGGWQGLVLGVGRDSPLEGGFWGFHRYLTNHFRVLVDKDGGLRGL